MNAAAVLAHALSVAHGVGASLACVAWFYIGGLALMPRRWGGHRGQDESPALLGAAVYVLVCWFGIALHIPLTRLAIGFASVVVLLAAVRYRGLAVTARPVLTRATLTWVLAFVVLYVLAYLFTMPPATAAYLPPAWTGNIDLLTYVRYTNYLLRLGPSNLARFSYLNDVYLQTPAVFYLLGGLSLFFKQDPLSAAMPAQFAFTALIGVFAARISQSVFRVSRASALAIGCIVVSGPFFRYMAGAYFLSSLMATPILLYVLWTTVSYRPQHLLDVGLTLRFACAYVLLLFIYPFLLFAGVAAQMATIVLMLGAQVQSSHGDRIAWREAGRRMGRTISSVLVLLGLLAVCLRQPNPFGSALTTSRMAWSIDMARALSEKGVAGWPLDFISPLAVLGLPGRMTDHVRCAGCYGIEVENQAYLVWAVAAFCAIALALGFLYFWQFRQRTTPAQRTLAGLAGGSFIAYCAYFFRLGPSYQQWKFASYSALPLSFVVFAGGLCLFQQSAPFARATRTALGRRLVTALLAVVAIGLVGGNLLVHAQSDPALKRFPGELHNLAKVDELPFFRDVSVQMTEEPGEFATWLALYFLPTKRVHVINSRFEPNERLYLERVSRQWPLLVQNRYGCEWVGHGETIIVPDVGCLLLAPPSLALATPYPFNRSFPFVEIEGLGAREAGGRWNGGSSVLLKLTVDPRRVRVDQTTYVNLRLRPFLPPGTTRQRLVFSWGANEHAEASLDAPGSLSLPVRMADWTGNWIWTVPISIDLPDRIAGAWVGPPEGRYQEDRPLAVVFEELSISLSPAGRVATRIVGVTH